MMRQVSANRGFTLVEVMITMTILGAAMTVAIATLNTANIETSLGTADAVLQNAANTLAEQLATELRSASRGSITVGTGDLATDYGYGDAISIQVPIDEDQDGTVDVDANGNPVLGATLGGVHTAGGEIVYRFVANQVNGSDQVMDEGTIGVDVNGDGDRDDTFTGGFFTRTAPDSGGEDLTRAAGGRRFFCGDHDNDSVLEPVFQRQADGSILFELWSIQIVTVGGNRVPARARVISSVMPLNP